MRKILYLIICTPLLLISACDVHEWPETPKFVKLHLRLNYETEMTKWEHLYDDAQVIGLGLGETYDNHQKYGKIRYIVRTYPISEKQRTMQDYVQEFVFTKNIAEGYDHEVMLDVFPGNYNIVVWSDLIKTDGNTHFYNADNFAEIMLQGDHKSNTDHRDAFKGKSSISLLSNCINQIHKTLSITMKRPLAKFEIVANDLLEFNKTKATSLNMYKAKIQYIGFMPSTYSLFADRPIASTTGVIFESNLGRIDGLESSIGFDYVFVSDMGSMVTVRIGIYNYENQLISYSEPITLPLKPNHHPRVTGNFLMQNVSDGVNIDPNFGGDYNIVL